MLDELIDLLSGLGMSTLSKCFDSHILERFSELGIQLDARTLTEYLVAEAGIDVLADESLRVELLISVERSRVVSHFGLSNDGLVDQLYSVCHFKWGDNPKTRRFLELFGFVLDDWLPTDSLKSEISLVSPRQSLYSYQNWVRKRLLRFLHGSSNRIMVHMPTGSGKTRTSLQAVFDWFRGVGFQDAVIVWFAHSEELCEQAVDTASALWEQQSVEPLNVLRYWGGRQLESKLPEGLTFAVIGFSTAYNMIVGGKDKQFSQFSAIRRKAVAMIVDEAHQSIAPTFSAAIESFSNASTKIIGLSATPGRHHVGATPEETQALSSFYENNKIQIADDKGEQLDDPIGFLTDRGILSRVLRFQLNSNIDFELSDSEMKYIEDLLEIPASVLARIGDDSRRTNLVVTNALRLVGEGRKVLVFSPTKQNAIEMAIMMKVKGFRAASITGDTPSHTRSKSIEAFKNGSLQALTNYGVLTTGFDAPSVDGVIIARPTKSVVLYSQMVGRGLRGPSVGGTEDCIVVDVVDNIVNMPSMADAFRYFDTYYELEAR